MYSDIPFSLMNKGDPKENYLESRILVTYGKSTLSDVLILKGRHPHSLKIVSRYLLVVQFSVGSSF